MATNPPIQPKTDAGPDKPRQVKDAKGNLVNLPANAMLRPSAMKAWQLFKEGKGPKPAFDRNDYMVSGVGKLTSNDTSAQKEGYQKNLVGGAGRGGSETGGDNPTTNPPLADKDPALQPPQNSVDRLIQERMGGANQNVSGSQYGITNAAIQQPATKPLGAGIQSVLAGDTREMRRAMRKDRRMAKGVLRK